MLEVAQSVDVSTWQFRRQMERNLAVLFNKAIERNKLILEGKYFGEPREGQGAGRRRRAVTIGNATNQVGLHAQLILQLSESIYQSFTIGTR